MSVDDLFSGGEPAVDPATIVKPLLRWSLAAALLNYTGFLGGLGLLFFRDVAPMLPDPLGTYLSATVVMVSLLAVPGAFVSVWAWVRADETLRKARTGALPETVGPPAYAARQRAFVTLMVAGLCLGLQIWALSSLLQGPADGG